MCEALSTGPARDQGSLRTDVIVIVTGCWGTEGGGKGSRVSLVRAAGGEGPALHPPPVPTDSRGLGPQGMVLAGRVLARCRCLTCRPLPAPPCPVAMDDEDGRCLLDVIW